MAGFFQQFLKGTVNGFLGSPNLKDYRHASKTFVASNYQNAPKFKWLFHVYFDINKYLIANNPELAFPSTSNYGLLVKSIDLPKFNLNLTEMNQYNRKRYVQTKISYEPVRITFHDDNASQLRRLWYAYYSYYYNDPSNPVTKGTNQSNDPDFVSSELMNKNIYTNIIKENQRSWGYNSSNGQASEDGFNGTNGTKQPFFKTIHIYGFNQHNFSLYQLINPSIESFNHDTYNYNEGNGIMENSMTVKYETVKYYEGALNGQNPGTIVKQFADPSVYDTELSPIARNGTNRTILGQGGLVDSVNGILGDIGSGNILGAIQTAGRVSRTFKNKQQLLQTAKAELVGGVLSAVSNPQTSRGAFNFPTVGSNSGNGGQNANATNARRTNPQPVATPNNTTISGGP